jgi:D-alanyl-D-alanine carboxypeptidase
VFSRRTLLSSGAAVAVVAAAGPVAASVASEPRRAARGGVGRGQIDEVAVHRIFGDTARELRVPGCVLLVQAPDQELFASYGTGAQGAIVPLSNFDRFRVGSVTKTMTATVILQLAQRGKLSLQDPVSRFVSGVSNGGEITIEQLMTMRSGLYDYAQSPSLSRRRCRSVIGLGRVAADPPGSVSADGLEVR